MKKILLMLLFAVAGVGAAQAQVVVVVNPSVSVDAVETGELLDIYSLDQSKWDNGDRVVAFSNDAVAGEFFGHLGRGEGDLKKVWLRKKLAGEGQPPQKVKSDALVVAQVASTPGAIGFVSAGAATDGVKVVATF